MQVFAEYTLVGGRTKRCGLFIVKTHLIVWRGAVMLHYRPRLLDWIHADVGGSLYDIRLTKCKIIIANTHSIV
jgi:hypothetical protein